MVTTANPYSDEQVLEMQAHARQPLVAITRVFLAFFLPPAIVAAILVVVSILHLELTTQLVLLAVAFAVAPRRSRCCAPSGRAIAETRFYPTSRNSRSISENVRRPSCLPIAPVEVNLKQG